MEKTDEKHNSLKKIVPICLDSQGIIRRTF